MLKILASLGQRVLRPRDNDLLTRAHPGTDRLQLLSAENAPSAYTGTQDLPASARPDPLARFALTPEHADTLEQLRRVSHHALDPSYHFIPKAQDDASEEFDALRTFYEKRAELTRKALAADPLRDTPARSGSGVDLARCSDAADVLKRLLKHNPGVVVGHAGMRLLADNMKLLRKLGVNTLYLDHLQTEVHQGALDQMHCRAAMHRGIARFVARLDDAHMRDVAGGNTYRALLDAALREGVRVVALDLVTSYHLKGAADPEARHPVQGADLRARVFSEVATRRIRHDQQGPPASPMPGPEPRWIALMDNAGAGTFNGNAGVGERLGVPTLRVEEVPAGKLPRFRAGYDPGRSRVEGTLQDRGELQCDHLVQVRQYGSRPVPHHTQKPCTAAEAAAARQLRAAIAACADDLARIGTYRVVRLDACPQVPAAHALVHRSGTGALVAQPIVPVAGGGLRLQLADAVDAERWGHVARPFADLAGLRQALSTRLQEVPAPSSPATRG